MSMSPSLSGANGGGGLPNEVRGASGVYISALTIVEAVEHREILRRLFDVYVTAWNTADNTSLSASYYAQLRNVEEEIQLCDLRIARIIETQGSYRQQRLNDEDIPF